jgi:hypothetical protein
MTTRTPWGIYDGSSLMADRVFTIALAVAVSLSLPKPASGQMT